VFFCNGYNELVLLTLLLTLCGLNSQKTNQGGLGLSGSVHEEAQFCLGTPWTHWCWKHQLPADPADSIWWFSFQRDTPAWNSGKKRQSVCSIEP